MAKAIERRNVFLEGGYYTSPDARTREDEEDEDGPQLLYFNSSLAEAVSFVHIEPLNHSDDHIWDLFEDFCKHFVDVWILEDGLYITSIEQQEPVVIPFTCILEYSFEDPGTTLVVIPYDKARHDGSLDEAPRTEVYIKPVFDIDDDGNVVYPEKENRAF